MEKISLKCNEVQILKKGLIGVLHELNKHYEMIMDGDERYIKHYIEDYSYEEDILTKVNIQATALIKISRKIDLDSQILQNILAGFKTIELIEEDVESLHDDLEYFVDYVLGWWVYVLYAGIKNQDIAVHMPFLHGKEHGGLWIDYIINVDNHDFFSNEFDEVYYFIYTLREYFPNSYLNHGDLL